MLAEKNAYIDAAFGQLQVISQDEEKRWEYLSREKALRDRAQYLLEADQRGHQRGLEEGRAEGRAEGIAEGKAEGRVEGIVTMCKKFGLDLAKTVAYVKESIPSLSEEEVETQVKASW